MARTRLSPLEQQALARFSAFVRGRFAARLSALTLFGSRARGEGHAHSDLDILVVVDDLTREERGVILDASADIGVEFNLALSPVVLSSRRWAEGMPLCAEVARDGVPL